MALLIIGLIAFLGVHSIRVFAPGLRNGLIASLGKGPWMGLYSVVSIATLALLAYGFGQARLESGESLYTTPAWMVRRAWSSSGPTPVFASSPVGETW